jgi:type VI secretion system protein ImpL
MRVTSGLRSNIPVIATNGPWALFRLLERGTLREAGVVGQSTVSFDFEGYKARIGLDMGNLPNPLLSHLLKDFSCPGSK